MASNPELTQWDAGVYQLETVDPIQGGAGGVDNLPHIQLGDRTQFLKARSDAVAVQVGHAIDNSDQQQLVSAVVLHVPTLAAVRAVPIPQVSNSYRVVVIARGGVSEFDGLGGTYVWAYAGSGADDNLNILTPSSVPALGRWLLLRENSAGIDAGKFGGQLPAYYLNAGNFNAGIIPTARLGSFPASAATWLRGDNVWATVDAVLLSGQAASYYLNASNLNAGTVAPSRLGSGSPSAANWLRGDGVWSTVDAAGLNGQNSSYYLNASNLSAGTVPPARLASGTANGNTYLRGDSIWSTVDAATLGGQSLAFLRNAGNINAGSVPDSHISQSSVVQHQAAVVTQAAVLVHQAAIVSQVAVAAHQTALTTRNISTKSGVLKTISSLAPSGGADGDIWYQT